MNQLRNTKFINILFLSATSIAPIMPTLSFRVNKSQFQFTYEYIHAFSKNEFNFSNSNNYTFWTKDEIIFQSNDFQIKFDSQNQIGFFYIDLYSYKVNKWYLIRVNYNSYLDFNYLDKTEVNNHISSIIVFNWQDDVSGKIKVNSDMALNDKKSIILKDGLATFQSSWGVWNKANSIVETFYSLNKPDIIDSLKIDWWDDSIDIERATLTKLQYIPLIEILDPTCRLCKMKTNFNFYK
ncbi:MAG: hypothetical protein HDR43_02030 [Mycoplasma sp.]|nr:hypothetical protein [Mycoplasma sp.]